MQEPPFGKRYDSEPTSAEMNGLSLPSTFNDHRQTFPLQESSGCTGSAKMALLLNGPIDSPLVDAPAPAH